MYTRIASKKQFYSASLRINVFLSIALISFCLGVASSASSMEHENGDGERTRLLAADPTVNGERQGEVRLTIDPPFEDLSKIMIPAYLTQKIDRKAPSSKMNWIIFALAFTNDGLLEDYDELIREAAQRAGLTVNEGNLKNQLDLKLAIFNKAWEAATGGNDVVDGYMNLSREQKFQSDFKPNHETEIAELFRLLGSQIDGWQEVGPLLKKRNTRYESEIEILLRQAQQAQQAQQDPKWFWYKSPWFTVPVSGIVMGLVGLFLGHYVWHNN